MRKAAEYFAGITTFYQIMLSGSLLTCTLVIGVCASCLRWKAHQCVGTAPRMLTCFKNVQRLTKGAAHWYYGTWLLSVFLDVHANCMMIFVVFYRSSTWSCSADTMDGSTRSDTRMSSRSGISHTDWSAAGSPTSRAARRYATSTLFPLSSTLWCIQCIPNSHIVTIIILINSDWWLFDWLVLIDCLF